MGAKRGKMGSSGAQVAATAILFIALVLSTVSILSNRWAIEDQGRDRLQQMTSRHSWGLWARCDNNVDGSFICDHYEDLILGYYGSRRKNDDFWPWFISRGWFRTVYSYFRNNYAG